MGNDILSLFIERKKSFIIQNALLFIRYLVDEKGNLYRTIEKITTIYFRDFWLEENLDFEELNSYFSLQNSKDIYLKQSLLSSIRFYQENVMEEKITQDIRLIVLLSNALYLSITLSHLLDKNYEKREEEWVPSFLKKYQNKIRLLEESKRTDFEGELFQSLKKEAAVYRKFFKTLENSQFSYTLEPILDYQNGYFVKGTYDIKMISRYSSKEIEQVYEKKNYQLDHALVTLEMLSFQYLKDLLLENVEPEYFLTIPFSLIEKEAYYEQVKTILGFLPFRKKIVFVFSYDDCTRHMKTLKALAHDQIRIGVNDLEEEVDERIFESVKYVFISPSFLESHSKYYPLFEDKEIRFILWEGGIV